AEGATLTLRMTPANGRAMTFRPKVLAAQPGVLLRWIGRLVVPGVFDGTHQFALDDLGGPPPPPQSQTLPGRRGPLTRDAITGTEESFRALNQALKQRVEHATG